MRPDLRDCFAIHFAAALTREQRYSIDFIVGRAYDLADAMIAERERRLEAEAQVAEEGGEDAPWTAAGTEGHAAGGLLDEAPPPSDADPAREGVELLLDPSWLEPPYDPSWDSEKWRVEPTPGNGPGLARTSAPTEAERAEQARRRKLA